MMTLPSSVLPSGIYLSSASVCPPPAFTPSPEFPDHYAIMGLDMWATPDEIREAHRRLRRSYFQSDPRKYKALQFAYGVLVNSDSRREYDKTYHQTKEVSPSAGMPPKKVSVAQKLDVRNMVERIELQKRDPTPCAKEVVERQPNHKIEDTTQQLAIQPEVEKPRDPVKHPRRVYEPTIGSRPYYSYIPLPKSYGVRERHPRLKCHRPTYMLSYAANSLP
ncbi:hypothetical protein CC78DRAFT_621689 [Lojkania enalia]|uniref:J domain-containing protein n=1 Tax=Lojkania enalia TaxID=147567 RepID=A0A9P4JXU9_9PLEO|nr:hypothetical protein CC78DRAFT_621689 [Didymosphaeria enalia]